MAKRGKLGAIIDILQVIHTSQNGAIISIISRDANTSHYVTKQYIKILIASGMITSSQVEQEKSGLVTTSYTLTDAGRRLNSMLNGLAMDLSIMNLDIL